MGEQETVEEYRKRSLSMEEDHEKKIATECSSFFRILPEEYPKFFSLAVLGFNIAFIHTALRDGKDVLIMSRMLPTSISFLKSTVVALSTIIFGFIFQWLMAKGTSMIRITTSIHLLFAIYFVVYSLFIIPLREYIEPYKWVVNDAFCDGKMYVNGLESLKGFLYIFCFWTSSFFYVVAELWSSIVLSLLHFGIINEVCPLRQALRFYSLLLVGSNCSNIIMGLIELYISSSSNGDPHYIDTFYRMLLIVLAVLCIVNLYIYRYLKKRILPYPIYIVSHNIKKQKKTKVGVLAGIKIAFSNPIILSLSVSVLSYGIVTNLIESTTNSSIIQSSGSTKDKGHDVMETKALQQIQIGVISLFFLFSPMMNFIQTKGWISLGILPPLFAIVGMVMFFGLIWLNTHSNSGFPKGFLGFFSFWNSDYSKKLIMEKYLGSIVISMMKILKYVVFDICKEAIGVKIPIEHRSRFKGVYDGVFSRFGKSISGAIQIVLLGLLNTNDIREAVFVIGTISIVMGILWIYATIYLGKKYEESVQLNIDLPVALHKDKKKKEFSI
ncbi:ATP:ADP antiporter, AAA family [Nematocida sp. LUAm3]|nr:ATP:ADP antiporter, AAA family [Nematocida sp. LUAm3]KAI5175547.1 ATP:ADP antiporter, AAA family [Nematocida sp. LUAm2]KAI5178423.1 ATP:ADP antiporter, AAA family [Nematocida sp. LUAm1]